MLISKVFDITPFDCAAHRASCTYQMNLKALIMSQSFVKINFAIKNHIKDLSQVVSFAM